MGRSLLLLPALALLGFACSGRAAGADVSSPPLFNGRDLDGWVNVNTAPSTWTVRDGVLCCSGRPIGELRTTRMFQNFELELEWRHLDPGGNAGIFLWADDLPARGQPFHRAIEVQVLDHGYGNTEHYTTHGDIFPIHGARMTPENGRGGSRAFPTEWRSNPSPDWNHYRIRCEDGAVSLAVNGKVVTRGTDAWPRKGYLCLESEGGRVEYRNLRLRELPSTPIDPADVAIEDRGYRSLYTGLDLAGWTATGPWRSRDWILACLPEESAGPYALTQETSRADFGFLFDVRIGSAPAPPRVLLRGDAASELLLDPATGLATGWNRVEGTVEGDLLTWSVNGGSLQTRPISEARPSGPLRFECSGPLDLANLFLRDLSP